MMGLRNGAGGEGGNGQSRDVARPRGATWRSLQSDGIEWEGQVLLVGGEVDLAARLIVTKRRLALVRGGNLALDIPRDWLRPEPRLVAENGVQLSVTPADAPPGGSNILLLRARDGRGAAAQIVAAVTGRELPWRLPEETDAEGDDEEPRWNETVGAAPPVALPPLSAASDPEAADVAPDTPDGPASPSARRLRGEEYERRGPSSPGQPPESISAWTARHLDGPAAVAGTAGATVDDRRSDDGAIDPPMVAALEEEEERSTPSRALLWSLRAAILLILVGTALYFTRDRLPIDASLARIDDWRDRWSDGTWDDRIARLPGGQGAEDPPPPATATATATATTSAEEVVTDTETQTGPTDQTATEIETERTTSTEPLESTEVEGSTETVTESETESLPPTDPPVDETTETASDDEVLPAPTDVLEAPVPTDTPVPTETPLPTETPTPAPTETPLPTATPTPTATAAPTDPPTATATATTAPTETVAVTESSPPSSPGTASPTATTEPTATSTPSPPTATATATATIAPTDSPAPSATTEPTLPPTSTAPATETPTEPVTPTPTPTLEPMPPAFDAEATPSQGLAAGPFRYTVEVAARGAEIAELPALTAEPGSEWVALAVHAQNWTDAEAVFEMTAFTLIVDGQEVQVDGGNEGVAGQLGLSPAYGDGDAVLFAPDEGHRFVLTFQIPAGAREVLLRAGDQTFALDRAVETSPAFAEVGPTPAAPQLQEARVVEVVNGEQITVEVEGRRQGVRYLGVDVPLESDCFASQSTETNRALVDGQTVYLERQSTNVDARGNWVRDVWIVSAAENEEDTANGGLILVADELVGQGAAVAAISSPNTRFADWLTAAEHTARAENAGLWGECGGLGNEPTPRLMVAPLPIGTAPWRDTPI